MVISAGNKLLILHNVNLTGILLLALYCLRAWDVSAAEHGV